MGIHGLLPLLKSIMVPVDVKELRGCTVAVDTYSWLHKGALSCSKELCTGQSASRHIDYCMHRVNLLRHHGIKPILVFDGGLLPMKNDQEVKRARSRKGNLERALEHESAGNSTAAYECYQKAVDISPSIAFELILVLRQVNVDYIVAPYEADAQMTFLSLNKLVDAVITEDSDLIPFGCSRIIFKMDKYGQGVEFQYCMLQRNKELNFTGFTKQMLLEMCILSGCDYLQSLPGMGLKRAHALIGKFKSYEKVIKHLRYSAVSVPAAYEETFKKAIWTFQYQRVYDPITEDIVHLTSVPHELVYDFEFLGPLMPQNVAKGIAQGDLDPFTKQPFQVASFATHGENISSRSYLLKEFKHIGERKKLELPAQKNVLTNYFCLASLEAKRKFRAPRLMQSSCPESKEESSPETEANLSCLTEEDSPCAINDSQASIPVSSIEADLPLKDHMEDALVHSPPLQKPQLETFQDNVAGRKKCEYNSVADGENGKERASKRKVIVRSSYFQPQSSNEKEKNGKENKDPTLDEDEASGAVHDFGVAKKAELLGNGDWKTAVRKRKFALNQTQTVISEVSKASHIHVNESFSAKGSQGPDLSSNTLDDDIVERKFGCNISHLSHYSSIAEKSLERFVSVISSFKCATLGSRASGLRAPLKDMRNTCPARSTAQTDLRNYSYVSRNRRT